jgi:hypothetical protein
MKWIRQMPWVCVGLSAAILTATATFASVAAPSYVPTGADIFEDYTALSEPRADVPVGALWVQDYGPFGEGAAADNLVTVRSVSGLSLNREQNLRLTLGLLSFLNIDPGLRSQMTARFSDITIVRVKEVAKLSGPPGEPRIYEALRAGTVTVTLNNDLGTDLGTFGGVPLPATGRAQAGRKRSSSMEGRDLFIAYRVVTPRLVSARPEEVPLRLASKDLGTGEYRLALGPDAFAACSCAGSSSEETESCLDAAEVPLVLSRPNGSAAGQSVTTAKARNGVETNVALPVPVSDGSGGVFTALTVKLSLHPSKRSGEKGKCGISESGSSKAIITFNGERLEPVKSPRARGW